MTLLELQKRMASALMRPLTSSDHMALKTDRGRSMRVDVAEYIKPNDRLTPYERLEIYSRSYWYRVLDSLFEDFPGLCAVVGLRPFERLATAYLAESPSESFTLRNLGSRLEDWLRRNPKYAGKRLALALDMIRLEWAHIEAFDEKAEKVLGPEDLLELGPGLRIGLQPYIRLLRLQYPVDDLRIGVNASTEQHGTASNTALKHKKRALVARVSRMKPQEIFLAVHRLDFMIYYRRLTAEEFRLLEALRHGRPIGKAIQAASQGSSIPPGEFRKNIEIWFATWAELGWFCRPAEPKRRAPRQP